MNASDERKALYQKCREDILKRQLSNTENFDRAILTLSTSILGLTLTFIRQVTPLEEATNLIFLFLAWSLFLIAIVVTLSSFLLSQRGLDCQLEYAEKYYLQQDNEYLKKKNIYADLTQYASWVAGAAFIFAILFLAVFVFLNIR